MHFLWGYSYLAKCLWVLPCCCIYQQFIPFNCWVAFHCFNILLYNLLSYFCEVGVRSILFSMNFGRMCRIIIMSFFKCLVESTLKASKPGVFFVGKANYQFNFFAIGFWIFYFLFSQFCIFHWICPFHLGYKIYWNTIGHNIFTINLVSDCHSFHILSGPTTW